MYANHTSVSHAYAHIVEFGEPVEIGGLKISSGDLLHGDRHGVVNIPLSVADEDSARSLQNQRGGAGTDRVLPFSCVSRCGSWLNGFKT